jgi:cell wall-associated NlpC family hydrolase
MSTPFEALQAKLEIKPGGRKGTGFNYTPYVMGDSTPGQQLFEKIGQRKDSGQNIYSTQKAKTTGRLAQDLVDKSAGLKFDEFGKPELNLTNFSDILKNRTDAIGQRGKLALQTEEAKQAWNQANNLNQLGSYGFTGSIEISGTDVPGASGSNPGAKAVSIAMQAMKNGTPYVYGGNSLSRGIDCSALVQQAYRQLGIKVPRTTYEQARFGKEISANQLRPGDLVFYNSYGHVGIYMGNGKIVHAANPKLGIITSNLTNSNGSPLKFIRPY